MKEIKRLLLINWHFFSHELIELETINFLTGKNAAGKSTIIDALQLLLLGDANGRNFFNKAANEKSQRSVKGYLRCELGDDGESGSRYLREGRFSSYIVCEVYDQAKRKSFLLGVVFDCYEDGQEEHKFFCLDGPLPEHHFIRENRPMSYKELRSFANQKFAKGKQDFPDSDRRFQEVLKSRLGGLKNKYFDLFKKAVSFTPITDIETFITEYVCDVKNPVDIRLMQDNIRLYKRLEFDAELMEKRVAALREIEAKHGEAVAEEQRAEEQRYISERARVADTQRKAREVRRRIGERQEDLAALAAKEAGCNAELEEVRSEAERLNRERYASELGMRIDGLQREQQEISEKAEALRRQCQETVKRLRQYGARWTAAAEESAALARQAAPAGERAAVSGEAAPGTERAALLLKWAAGLKELEMAAQSLRPWGEALAEAKEDVLSAYRLKEFDRMTESARKLKSCGGKLLYLVGEDNAACQKEREEKLRTLDNLKKGIKNYDQKLLELKGFIEKELKKKHGEDTEVHIFAELLEFRDRRWQNSIEGYLHTQKFRLIVEPAHFVDALKVYDRMKKEKGYYGIGIVNTGKLLEKRPKAEAGSLAEEVVTDHPLARAYADFLLGRVIKCDKVEELQLHKRSITDTGMLYQNFVAEQINPARWRDPFIGRRAIEQQILNTKERIQTLEDLIGLCGSYRKSLEPLETLPVFEFDGAEAYQKALTGYLQVPALEEKLAEIQQELESLDLTWVEKLERKMAQAKERIANLEQAVRNCARQAGQAEEEIRSMETEQLPRLLSLEEEQTARLKDGFDPVWAAEKGELRFLELQESRTTLEEIIVNFSRAMERSKSLASAKRKSLEDARSRYNMEYTMSYDFQAQDNEAYKNELELLAEIRLPEYRQKINDAREKSYQQFSDDFIAKLKGNIDTVKEQIKELNDALKESSWGSERYHFTWTPKPEYRKYYDMITDSMLLEGYSLSSQAFREKHADAIEELFRNITDVDPDASSDARAEIEKNVRRFTDYRTYLAFDLVVSDLQGREDRLSRTMRKKSGGETQTPFYISVLASFAQLYRIKDPAYNRIGLIVFDEAFSKMDSERIRESIRLLRRFGFQCILSAPPDKIGDIAPLVDRNLCVFRENSAATVKAFDARQIEEGM
ncbi:MAG: SbcC/MukB-like Walker B domain-containing protein [Bacillota bacterium]|nr:SbcC/MukB-like Walker B domain-containing protein [Bacillota bacterium]